MVYLVVISLQFYSTCHSSSVNFHDLDAFEDYRPVILNIVPHFGFVCYFLLIRLWSCIFGRSITRMQCSGFLTEPHYMAHDFNLSCSCGFLFIYLIRRCLPALSIVVILICKRSFLGCGGRMVLGNYSLKKKYLVWIDPWFPVLVNGL